MTSSALWNVYDSIQVNEDIIYFDVITGTVLLFHTQCITDGVMSMVVVICIAN